MHLPDPADPDQLPALLARHGIRARKEMGQNFLVDVGLRDRIIEAVGLTPEDEVLEVGSGAGTLTLELAKRSRRLVAVELERRLVHLLRSLTAGLDHVQVLEADILQVDFESLFPAGGHILVGNIPYYLTGALLPRLLEPKARPRRLALVVQEEVARRWTEEGDWSLSSVAVHIFANPRLVLSLPPAAFQPSPKVESALVLLEVRDRPALEEEERAGFFHLVERVFQFRRKQLAGTLARVLKEEPALVAERLRGLGIEPSRRPQTLSLAEWVGLYRSLRYDHAGPGKPWSVNQG